METIETIRDPNFSIIMPTSCNAKCSFCFWKPTKKSKEWIFDLEAALDNLPKQFWQISITGAEPTSNFRLLDAVLHEIYGRRYKFKKVVFTTNGFRLDDYLSYTGNVGEHRRWMFKECIDHVNISRHHWKDNVNSSIFKSNTVPSQTALAIVIEKLNKLGIDVNLNCVLAHFDFSFNPASLYKSNSNAVSKTDCLPLISQAISDMVMFTKQVGASSICFRVPSADDSLEHKHHTEKNFITHGYESTSETGCPVCKSVSYLIKGVPCTWKYSIPEPMDKLDDLIYETVLHPNGKLTADWKGECELEF